MNSTQFLAYFDRICEVPDAIPSLRQFIVELAVRGKLVECDPNDEPASELLKRILAEKERRIRGGQMKRQEPLPKVRPDEAWFGVPASWSWVRLGTVTQVLMGQSPPGETYNTTGEGIPLINGPVEFTEGAFGKTVVNQYTTAPTNVCEEGDLLLCVRGSTTGRTNIAGFRACIGRGVAAIRSFFADQYVRLFIWRLRAFIIAMGRGIAFPSVSRRQIEELPVPLPPLAEQHRIVAKVDELMVLCDRLEAAQAEREGQRDRVVAASLNRLNNGADAESFREHARFHLRNLRRLATRPEHIQQLRQTILDLGVRGNLVSSSSTPLASDRNVGHFVRFLNGYAFESKSFRTMGIRLCRNVNVGHGNLNWNVDNTACISEESATAFRKFDLTEGDIVLSLDRPLISTGLKVARLTKDDLPCLLLQRVAKAEFLSEELNPAFFLIWLQSSEFKAKIDPGRSKGVPHISTRQIEALPISVPPVAMQKRIISKVIELTDLCNELEARLESSLEAGSAFLEATLFQTLWQQSEVGKAAHSEDVIVST